MSKRMLAEEVGNGHLAQRDEPVESVLAARTWYVAVYDRLSGRPKSREPFKFTSSNVAAEAIHQLEEEHRQLGLANDLEVKCWAE